MGDEVGTIENGQLIYRINCDKHYLAGVAPILVLQKDSVKPPLIILEGNNTQPDSKPIIRDERMNKSIGYIIQDNRVLPTQPLSPPISSSAFSPQQQQAFYPPPSTTWNQNSPTIPTNHNNSNISSSLSSSASQDPSFYGNQPFHLLSPTTNHHPSPYPQINNNTHPYQQQSPPLDYNHHPLNFNYHHDLTDPLSPTQHEPFYWNTPKLSSQQLSSPSSSSNINDHWVLPNQYPSQYPPPNHHHPNQYQDNSYYPSSPTYHPSDQQYNPYHPPNSGRQPAFRLIQRPN